MVVVVYRVAVAFLCVYMFASVRSLSLSSVSVWTCIFPLEIALQTQHPGKTLEQLAAKQLFDTNSGQRDFSYIVFTSNRRFDLIADSD